MEPLDALERAYEHAEHVVAKTTPSDYARPTPCPEWDVRALLNHLVGSISLFPAMLARRAARLVAQLPR